MPSEFFKICFRIFSKRWIVKSVSIFAAVIMFFVAVTFANNSFSFISAFACNIGTHTCQGGGGNNGNTGSRCVCTANRDWDCSEYNTNKCPIGSDTNTGPGTNPVTCTAINGKRYGNGDSACSTLNGLQNGNKCTCFDLKGAGATGGDTGTWRCEVDGKACSIETNDPRVVDGNASTNCNIAVNGVSAGGGCVTAPAGSTVSNFYCPNQSQTGFASGCSENGSVGNSCINSSCGGHQIDVRTPSGATCYYSSYIPCTTNPPGENPTPTPVVVPAQCTNIKMLDPNGAELTGNADASLVPGSSAVKFECSANGTIAKYEFRVILPDGTIQTEQTDPALATIGAITSNYIIPTAGKLIIQCRVCTTVSGQAAPVCQEYEPIAGLLPLPTITPALI
jgi:hypothetical protein